MQRCGVTDLLIDQCACPQHRNIEEDEPRSTRGSKRVAQFGGTCAGCECQPIRRGDHIILTENGWELQDCVIPHE